MDHISLNYCLTAASERNLSISTLRILCHLHTHKRATHGTLNKELGVSVSAVTGLSDRLVSLGYAKRRHGTNDRRQIWLEINPAGTAAIQEILSSTSQTVSA